MRILVNGQTGRIHGVMPFSWARLGLVAAIAVAIMAAALMVLGILARALR